jgi:hypothetical protein
VSNAGMSTLLIVVAVICLAAAVFYAIPGIYHPLVFSGDPTAHHYKHTAVFVALAVLCGLGARFARSSAAR